MSKKVIFFHDFALAILLPFFQTARLENYEDDNSEQFPACEAQDFRCVRRAGQGAEDRPHTAVSVAVFLLSRQGLLLAFPKAAFRSVQDDRAERAESSRGAGQAGIYRRGAAGNPEHLPFTRIRARAPADCRSWNGTDGRRKFFAFEAEIGGGERRKIFVFLIKGIKEERSK